MIKTGIVSATFRSLPAEEIIRLCTQNNLIGVEWSENAHVLPNDEIGAKLLRKKTLNAGLQVAAYGSYYRLGSNSEPEKAFMGSLVSATALGAPLIRVWAGEKPSNEVSESELAAIAKEAALIADMAEEKGIKIAFEWHKNTLTDTNESAIRLLKAANHSNLYCLWQPTVALSEAERCQGIQLLSDRLLNLHIYYWLEGVRRPLAEGEQLWQKYLSKVDKSSERFALLEFVMDNTEEQFCADAAALNSWIKQYNNLDD